MDRWSGRRWTRARALVWARARSTRGRRRSGPRAAPTAAPALCRGSGRRGPVRAPRPPSASVVAPRRSRASAQDRAAWTMDCPINAPSMQTSSRHLSRSISAPQAWKAWLANRMILRCWRVGIVSRARLFNRMISSVALWGMETVATRQKDREAMSTPSRSKCA